MLHWLDAMMLCFGICHRNYFSFPNLTGGGTVIVNRNPFEAGPA